MSLHQGVAIYRQVIDYFKYEIASRRLKPGDRIESIRALASTFKINPNTVQKALGELERGGLIETDRTNGKYVTMNTELIDKLRQEVGAEIGEQFIQACQRLEISYDEMKELMDEAWRRNNE